MTRNTIARLTGTAVATAVASVALASPTAALVVPEPGGSTERVVQQNEPTAASSDGIPWTEVGVGALAGITLLGAVAAATGARQRRHPAPQA